MLKKILILNILIITFVLNAKSPFLKEFSDVIGYKIPSAITEYGEALVFLRMLGSPKDTKSLFVSMKKKFPLDSGFWNRGLKFLLEKRVYLDNIGYNIEKLKESVRLYMKFLEIYEMVAH